MVAYTYLIYPVILVGLAALKQALSDLQFAFRRRERRPARTVATPRVSMVFAAHNEEAVMAEKMRNCATLDYPPDLLEVLVGCDGCSDGTIGLARAAALPNARIFDYSQRSGKPEVLNRLLMTEARGDVVVLSDANTMLDPQAVRFLVRRFEDPQVGCVCGDLRLTSAGEPKMEGAYWRYEVFLKFLESRLGLLLGANGGVYAIRPHLFSPIPPEGIIDDFLIAMQIRKGGHRVIFDPEAFALEEPAPATADEFRRRIRIGAGNFHALRLTASLLTPWAGRIAFSYWSHKVFRWLVPFALPLAFLSAAVLAPASPFYMVCVAMGAAVLALGSVGYFLERWRAPHLLFRIPFYFLSMNLALLLGFVRFLTGSQRTVWQRTRRERAN